MRYTKSDGALTQIPFPAAPNYAMAATNLKEDGIKLGKVDCTTEQPLCEKYNVRGYPTLKVFRKGEPKDFAGGRETESIVSYMKK
jgi:protein disulfide-isomerase A1